MNVHDICLELMKPAKGLAAWNVPLSELLTTFQQLLEKADNLIFSEAGLMLANSANVYGQRIESLYDNLLSLVENVEKLQGEQNPAVPKQHKKVTKKIDFDDFVLVEIEANKDTDLKNDNIKKPPKLLPKQFVQAEKPSPETLKEVIIDVNGDIIGKKYSFRCNQEVTKYGLLTDELNPEDFGIETLNDYNTSNTSVDSVVEQGKMEDSGYQSNNDTNIFDDSASCDINCSADSVNVEDETTKMNNNLFDNHQNIKKSNNESNNNNNSHSNIQNISDSLDVVNDKDKLNTSNNVCEALNINEEKDEAPEKEVQALEKGQQNIGQEKRRSKRLETVLDQNNKANNLEPIFFDQDFLNIHTNKELIFQFPYQTVVSTKKTRRKRKCQNTSNKLLKEEPPSKKMDIKTPTTEMFSLLKKEDIDELQKSLDMCLGSYLYDTPAVIMGFDPTYRKGNLILDSPAYCIDDVVMPFSPDNLETPDSFNKDTPPLTPQNFDTFDESVEKPTTKLKSNFNEIVQKKLKDVQKSRKRSPLEETVSKWHEKMKPILGELEKRGTFNIHKYSSDILSTFSRNNEQKTLLSTVVVCNQALADVSRYFNATLQLANTYNVEIKPIMAAANIEITLLNSQQSHKRL